MMFGRPVACRLSRSAASIASLPEFAKNIRSRPCGSTSPSRSTSVSSGRCMTVVYCAWISVPTCRCAASTTRGWQCPVLVTPMPGGEVEVSAVVLVVQQHALTAGGEYAGRLFEDLRELGHDVPPLACRRVDCQQSAYRIESSLALEG